MDTFDRNGTRIVCTSTREERMAQENAEPIHFVASESFGWVDE